MGRRAITTGSESNREPAVNRALFEHPPFFAHACPLDCAGPMTLRVRRRLHRPPSSPTSADLHRRRSGTSLGKPERAARQPSRQPSPRFIGVHHVTYDPTTEGKPLNACFYCICILKHAQLCGLSGPGQHAHPRRTIKPTTIFMPAPSFCLETLPFPSFLAF